MKVTIKYQHTAVSFLFKNLYASHIQNQELTTHLS